MATNDAPFRDEDFESAFNEDTDTTSAGMDLEGAEEREEGASDSPAEEAAETAGNPEGAPAVVIVAEVDEGEGAVKPSAAAAETPTEGEEEAEEQAAGKTAKPTGNQRAEQQAKAVTPQSEESAEEMGEQHADPYDMSDVPPEDMQKAKSWMGRMKKMEEELKARLAAAKPAEDAPAAGAQKAADAIQQAAEQADAAGDTDKAQAAADVAQQVKDGEITPQEAMKMLAEDFGDDFVKMVAAVAKSSAGKPAVASEELEQTKAELQALRDQATRDHFEAIYDEHPDFAQVYEDPAFRKWAHDNGKDQVVEAGSARQINKMLKEYKTTAKAAPAPAADTPAPQKQVPAKVDQAALDAAEGVRGGAVRLPEKPARATDDFARAFEEF